MIYSYSKMILKMILYFTLLSIIYEIKRVQCTGNDPESSSKNENVENEPTLAPMVVENEPTLASMEVDDSSDEDLIGPLTTSETTLKTTITTKPKCARCHLTNHSTDDCSAKDYPCFNCNEKDHLYRNCTSVCTIPLNVIQQQKDFILMTLKVTPEERCKLQEDTKDKSEKWLQARKFRLTAADFGTVCNLKDNDNSQHKLQRIITNKLIKRDSDIKPGYKPEDITNALEKLKKKPGYENVIVIESGLFIDEEFYQLGGTPDGLIGNNAIVKIRCPEKWKNLKIADALKLKKNFLKKDNNNKFHLKTTDQYYTYIQGLLQVANKQSCHLIVLAKDDVFVEVIERDTDYWEKQMKDKLIKFHDEHYLYAAAIISLRGETIQE